MMTKDDRRSRYDRRKAKHVRDIRRKDYIGNERDEVTAGSGGSKSVAFGSQYHISKGKNGHLITNGGGWMGGNPRFNRHADVPSED